MATQTLGQILIQMGVDATALQQGLAAASSMVAQFGASTSATLGTTVPASTAKASAAVQGLRGHLESLGAAFGQGAAIATAVSALGAVGQAAAATERGEVLLKTAVEAAGESWQQYAGSVDGAVEKSKQLGFTTDVTRSALGLLITQTGSVAEAVKRLGIAQDLARATGMDLYSTSRLVGKITDENVSALGRLGIAIRKGTDEQTALAEIQARVAGQAEAQSNTMSASAERFRSAWTEAMSNVGTALNGVIPQVMAAAIAFNALGLSAIFRVGGLAAAAEGLAKIGIAMRGVAVASVAAAWPILLVAGAVALVAAGVYQLGKTVAAEGSQAQLFAAKVDEIRGMLNEGGLEGVLSKLTGIGQQVPTVSSAMVSGASSAGVYGNAVAEVSEKLTALGTTGAPAALKSINDELLAFTGGSSAARTALAAVKDIVAGTSGLTDRQRLAVTGDEILANARKSLSPELDAMQALRDSAAKEGESVARFWEDEANRKADFSERLQDTIAKESEAISRFWSDEAKRRGEFALSMAERAKPVIETIDQLNKDLGTGFDQRRRALQAEAKKEQFAAETAVLQRKEDERIAALRPPTHEGSTQMEEAEAKRIARVRPPATPELDKIVAKYGSIEAFDAAIAGAKERLESAMTVIARTIKERLEDLDEAVKIAARREIFQSSGAYATAQGDEREDAQHANIAALRLGSNAPGGTGYADPGIFGGGAPGRSEAIGTRILDTLSNTGTAIDTFGKQLTTWQNEIGAWKDRLVSTPFQVSGGIDITNSDGSIARANQDEVQKAVSDWFAQVLAGAQAKLNAGQSDAAGNAILA